METPSLQSVFHAVTDLAPGTDQLLPLSGLRQVAPDTYTRAIAKYDTPERLRLKDTFIPVIERRWTEVVFLTPVDPRLIWSAWRELSGQSLPPMQFWRIPVEDVPPDAVVFDRTVSQVGEDIRSSEVARFLAENYKTPRSLPAASREWLTELAARGRRGAWFNRTPHILTSGPVSLERASVLSWDDLPDR